MRSKSWSWHQDFIMSLWWYHNCNFWRY